MKKIYGFLTAAAILLTAACTTDLDGPNKVDEVKGDMYMSIAIQPTGPIGTRTPTPGQGQEIGKDRENKISTALVIFAEKEGDNYKVVTSEFSGSNSDFQLTGNPQGNYVATFLVDRSKLLADIGEDEKDYYIFVIANASAIGSDLQGEYITKGKDLQQVFATEGDQAIYWQADNFLMTNSVVKPLTITADEIKKGTHIVATDPFNLGTIKVQRAMSRFDLATDLKYTKFTATNEGRDGEDVPEGGNSDLKDLTIEFDGVALINMAQKANMFKVTAANNYALKNKTISFTEESQTNWVFTPVQAAFSAPLFSGAPDGGLQTGTTVTDGLESFFVTEAPEDGTNHIAVNRVGGYTKMANFALSETENAWNVNPSDKPTDVPTYKIWRYCMENTNPGADSEESAEGVVKVDNQKNGNTTGVVFRAQITGKKVDGTPLSAGTDGPLYAYNNVIIGNAAGLRTYVISPKAEADPGVYEVVKLKYESAVAKYNTSKGEPGTNDNQKITFEEDKTGTDGWNAPEGSELSKGYTDIRKVEDLSVLDQYLVKNGGGFSIYRPTKISGDSEPEQYAYYCYYIYWNRHNDNGDNSQMGPMEFSTVRNNVYKLRVTKVHKLGHPGKPGDDPDDPKPDDPDEKDSFYCQVICQILPWEVRLNDIEF